MSIRHFMSVRPGSLVKCVRSNNSNSHENRKVKVCVGLELLEFLKFNLRIIIVLGFV